LIICSDNGSLPSTIITTGITLIKLEAMVCIISGKQECYSKRPQSTILRISLFVVTDVFYELFDGDLFAVLILVATSAEAGLVNEDIGVGCETGDVACCVLA